MSGAPSTPIGEIVKRIKESTTHADLTKVLNLVFDGTLRDNSLRLKVRMKDWSGDLQKVSAAMDARLVDIDEALVSTSVLARQIQLIKAEMTAYREGFRIRAAAAAAAAPASAEPARSSTPPPYDTDAMIATGVISRPPLTDTLKARAAALGAQLATWKSVDELKDVLARIRQTNDDGIPTSEIPFDRDALVKLVQQVYPYNKLFMWHDNDKQPFLLTLGRLLSRGQAESGPSRMPAYEFFRSPEKVARNVHKAAKLILQLANIALISMHHHNNIVERLRDEHRTIVRDLEARVAEMKAILDTREDTLTTTNKLMDERDAQLVEALEGAEKLRTELDRVKAVLKAAEAELHNMASRATPLPPDDDDGALTDLDDDDDDESFFDAADDDVAKHASALPPSLPLSFFELIACVVVGKHTL